MYNLLLILQYMGIIILFLELLYIIFQQPSRPQTLLLIFVIATLVNSTGYLFELQADNLQTALTAVKFSYLGKPFTTLCMFLFILYYCRIKLPKTLTALLVLIHFGITALVFTCEHHTLYYSSISYTQEGLFPHLILGHGIFYNFYLMLLGIYTLLIPIVCIHAYRRTQEKTERQQLQYLFAMVVIADTCLLLFLAKVTNGYDTTALSYVISSVLLLLSFFRHNLFDTLALAKDYVIDNLSDGLIVIDSSGELIYSNQPAKALYPNLDQKHYPEILEDIKKHYFSNQKLHYQGNVYEISCRAILHNDMNHGTMYLFSNITNSYHYTARLQKEVKAKTKELVHIQHSIIASFASMVEARDGITGLHIKRTSAYVSIITQALQASGIYPELLTDDTVSIIIDAAPLHDIGKISVPDAILSKPGRLTEEEFEVIKTHPAIGAQIIEETLGELEEPEYLSIARDMAYYHHEKWDGTGYPCGLSGSDIPLCARIMAIADVYDALRSKRSYKDAFSKEKALSIIEESSGSHFDPAVVAVFVANIQKIEQI